MFTLWGLSLILIKFATSKTIPTIDISSLTNHSSPDRPPCLEQIHAACRDYGFFHIINFPHVKSSTSKSLSQSAASLFFLPFAEKQRFKRYRIPTFTNSRGYANDEHTKNLLDSKELFDVGPPLTESDPSSPTQDGFNQWPASLCPQIKSHCEEFYAQCELLAEVLFVAIMESLGVSQQSAEEMLQTDYRSQQSSFLRLNYYPPVSSSSSNSSSLGISRHTDAGALTILKHDLGVPSLEVYTGSKQNNDDGEWIKVEVNNTSKELLTVNLGDIIEVLSQRKFKAAEHRVKTAALPRFSFPFFFNPRYSLNVTDGTTLNYNWGDFRARRVDGDFPSAVEERRDSDVQIEDFLVK